ncbi:MAG TPA: AAA family ATPase [Euzebya sp.]|nr:AAA family ATPase [Euzebya sp.]
MSRQPVPPGAPRLVGRAAELRTIESALDRVGQRVGVGVVIIGEAGSGKSLLLEATSQAIDARGWYVVHARADVLERQIPYAALARAVRPLAQDRSPAVVEAAQAMEATVHKLDGSPTSDAEASFGRVVGQATQLLSALLERRPVGLLLDDLEAFDDDTIALIAILIRRLSASPLAVIATSRTDPRTGAALLSTLLRRMQDETDLHLVELESLGPEAIAEVITPVVGAKPDALLVAEVYRRTSGNPFFALEIAGWLAQTGALTTEQGQVRLSWPQGRLPLSRADTLLERFVRLDTTTRAVVESIAVLGGADPTDLGVLSEMAGIPEDEVAEAFDGLVRQRLLVPQDGGYAFTHDLLRDALYDGLGPARRRLLHRIVAERLAADRAAGRPADLLTLARHIALVAQPGDAAAVDILAEAADLARRIAPVTAAAWYARAIELRPADPSLAATLQARRGRALALAGLPAEAAEIGLTALDTLGPGEERDHTTPVVISSLVDLGRLTDALAVADAEIAGGRAAPPLISQRAWILWHLQRFDEALAEGVRAEALTVGSAAERVLVLGPLLLLAAYTDRPRPLVDLAEEMLCLGPQLPTTLDLYVAAYASYALASSGCAAAALDPLQRAEDLLDTLGGTAFRATILAGRVHVDWLQGRWDEALEGIRAALLELEGAQFALLAGALTAIEIEIQTCRGVRSGADVLDQPPPTPNIADLRAWAVAGVHEANGDLDAARAALAGALRARREQTAYRSPLQARRIEVELAAGRKPDAERFLAEMEADAQAHTNPWGRILLHRCRALVRGDPAEGHAAVAAAEEGGYAFERARSLLVVAELDAGGGAAALEAYRQFQALGADPFRRRAGALLRQRGIPVPRQRGSQAGPLSESELRVARLVQRGLRNKEIASALHYSTRTVEVYLSRIYRKLGISSRLELARALDAGEV